MFCFVLFLWEMLADFDPAGMIHQTGKVEDVGAMGPLGKVGTESEGLWQSLHTVICGEKLKRLSRWLLDWVISVDTSFGH